MLFVFAEKRLAMYAAGGLPVLISQVETSVVPIPLPHPPDQAKWLLQQQHIDPGDLAICD